ncbi:histone-fold-containing protein [Punctularia strigosozonata HHB-11173 SS5]|uniref:histone-fold-containing protein n=1 Tax=Punctularia strigosozonata (strain HHB-11173) TaxID=741275 RepID=UPI000441710B|nr:histone-fold-containing protein [Punctularia strigosozonata HHB-11173 SS5]EIN06798.1 histone-fold-containing protein [Punctularia strigosozonata HHB-11173 SS5]
MPRKDAGTVTAQSQQDMTSDGIENFELPKSLVTKIAKSAIPDNSKLQKETVLALMKGSTVFINYLAATAHDIAISKQHKSISASDVLRALELIEFGDMVPMLQGELQIYKDNQKGKKGGASTAAKAPPVKGKGKAKAADAEEPTSISTHMRSGGPMDADGDDDDDAPASADIEVPEDQDDEMADASEPGDEPPDEPDEADEDEDETGSETEPEEIVDTMAVEDEELRKDALSIERREKEEARTREELASEL